jgi:diguanylate cyclase (GGDEF)-like protein/PAS domain S-box-containing protein
MALAANPLPRADQFDARAGNASEAARMLGTLIANIDGMVYRCHVDSQWTMEFVSDGCQAVTGYGPEDLLFNNNISYEQITHPEDRLRVRSVVNAALAHRQRFDVEYRIVHRNGTERWVWERGVGLYAADGSVVAVEGIIQDISAREATYRALRNAERRYRSLFDNAIEGIFRTSADGRYLDANPALARIYGFETPLELMNSLSDISAQLYVDPQRRQEFIDTIRQRGSVSGFESRVRRQNGELIWISENARAVHDDSGRLVCYEGTVENVTELHAYKERIERQARYDDLTGLANRALLREALQDAVRDAALSQARFALVFVDLDRFKFINDSLGHHAGDELLCVTARRLTLSAPQGCTVARVGGDEFVLLVPGADEEEARRLTRNILHATGQPWHFNGTEQRVHGSVGIALFPDHGRDPETLLRNADAAMYQAKDEGRGTLRVFSTELQEQMAVRLDVEQRLREAIERNHLLLHFQPRFDLATGQVAGAEALVRWQAPGEALVHPASFITIAEETGLIIDIGRYVLRAACTQMRAWRDAGRPDLMISINASPRELQEERYAEQVLETLREFGLPPDRLEIEITESMVVQDAPRLSRMLGELHQAGVQLAIDDFGTGYSNLRYLQSFPARRLKIDRSFISDILRNGDDAAIVRAIITLGHSLGMRVVAEGVEERGQLDLLCELGCDEIQGFLLGMPLPAEAFQAHCAAAR